MMMSTICPVLTTVLTVLVRDCMRPTTVCHLQAASPVTTVWTKLLPTLCGCTVYVTYDPS